jgi:hypothetical protein
LAERMLDKRPFPLLALSPDPAAIASGRNPPAVPNGPMALLIHRSTEAAFSVITFQASLSRASRNGEADQGLPRMRASYP